VRSTEFYSLETLGLQKGAQCVAVETLVKYALGAWRVKTAVLRVEIGQRDAAAVLQVAVKSSQQAGGILDVTESWR
jgi:hypothetical protein